VNNQRKIYHNLNLFSSIGWGDALVFARYGPSHTQQRKLFQDAFGKNVLSQYSFIQERETNILLKGLVNSPRDYERHVQRYIFSLFGGAVRLLSVYVQVLWRHHLGH
jgi:cytochrome P450